MTVSALETICAALNQAGVRYLVAGGLAVAAHGYLRVTLDVDVVIHFERQNVLSAFEALGSIGYHPTVPVTAEQFANETQRDYWHREKNMQVLNFFSDRHRATPVDVFVTAPFDFDAEYDRALKYELAPGLDIRFVSIPTLIAMKQQAGRARDLDDIQHLRWILENERDESD